MSDDPCVYHPELCVPVDAISDGNELMIPEIIFTVVTTLFLYRLILFINRWLKRMENRRDTTIV